MKLKSRLGEMNRSVKGIYRRKARLNNALPLFVHDLNTSPTHTQPTVTHENIMQNLELEPQTVSASQVQTMFYFCMPPYASICHKTNEIPSSGIIPELLPL